jgi:predicted NUDIX family NTP pyrophosphohydrolase
VSVRRSSGILLFRRTPNGLEVLLAHPGGPFFARRDAANWSIPKGQPDGEDDLLLVAEREFSEETGHRIEDVRGDEASPMELGTVTLGSGKVVHAWAIEGDLDPEAVVSNEFEIEWPPRSGRRARFPEVDRVAWMAPDAARHRIHPAQAAFLDRLEALLRSG